MPKVAPIVLKPRRLFFLIQYVHHPMDQFPYRRVHSFRQLHKPSANTDSTTRLRWPSNTPTALNRYNNRRENSWYCSSSHYNDWSKNAHWYLTRLEDLILCQQPVFHFSQLFLPHGSLIFPRYKLPCRWYNCCPSTSYASVSALSRQSSRRLLRGISPVSRFCPHWSTLCPHSSNKVLSRHSPLQSLPWTSPRP